MSSWERRAFATGPRPCLDRRVRFLEGSLILAYRSCPEIVLDIVERWSGPLLLIGGGMIVVTSIIHPQGTGSQFVLQSLWMPVHIIEYFAWMIILLGFVGWYSRFSTSLGRLGTLGFLLFFFAGATGGGYSLWINVLLEPYMAANSPSLENGLSTNSGYIATFLTVGFALVVGYLVFSVAVVRARVLPRWGLWLIVLQIIALAFFFGVAIAFAAFLVFSALFGLGIAGWGYALLSTRRRVESSERLQVG